MIFSGDPLPHWVAWFQALGPPILSGVLALFGAWIAYKQVQIARRQEAIARAKLRADRYDRRYAIFDAFRKMIGAVLGGLGGEDSETPAEAIRSATWALGEAQFLLDQRSVAFLKDLLATTISFNGARDIAEVMRHGPQSAQKDYAQQQSERETKLLDSFPSLVDVFSPYLRLDDLGDSTSAPRRLR